MTGVLEMVVQIGAPFEYQQSKLQLPETCVKNVSQRLHLLETLRKDCILV